MADEIVHDAPETGGEVTDLRSTIVAAIEKQRTPEPEPEVTPEPEKVEAKPDAAAKDDKPETEAERNQRLRDEKGKFATEKNAVKTEPKPVETAPAEGEAPKPEDDGKPALRPPPGWSPTAKMAFDKLPPEVQQAVAKREEEVNNGFAKFQEYKPIDRFMEMAKQSGTTLDKALENYVGIETELRRDFIGGISRICQNQGVSPLALANQILARHGAAPSEVQPGEQPEARQQAPSVDPAIMHKISALESYIQQQQQAGIQTEIQRFASDPKHTFFENVRADMSRLMNSGYAETMEDAYEKACWANPEIRALLIKQQSPPVVPSANAADAVQKAKAAAKATGGAPSVGFKPKLAPEGASVRETVIAAVNAQRGI